MIPQVRDRLSALFRELQPTALVCAAACGADSLALDAAEALKVPTWVVLPFAVARFRETSVIDRGLEWGPRFDHQVNVAEQAGRLIVDALPPDHDATYLQANESILDQAVRLAGSVNQVRAVIVWEGEPRSGVDVTYAFAESARKRNIAVLDVATR